MLDKNAWYLCFQREQWVEHGLFFDVGGISWPLAGANIDVTGVADAKGTELMYFEIPVDKYLNAPSKP